LFPTVRATNPSDLEPTTGRVLLSGPRQQVHRCVRRRVHRRLITHHANTDPGNEATWHVAGVAALWAEKLMKAAQFTQQRFTDRLVGSAITASLKPDFSPADVGNGVAQAPPDEVPRRRRPERRPRRAAPGNDRSK
jgi:hypothetical protein